MEWNSKKGFYEQEPEVLEWAQNLIDTTEPEIIKDEFERPTETRWSDGGNALVQTVIYKHHGEHPESWSPLRDSWEIRKGE